MPNRPQQINYAHPPQRQREPAQWWVLGLILGIGIALMGAVFLLARIFG